MPMVETTLPCPSEDSLASYPGRWRPLVSPRQLRRAVPVPARAAETVRRGRRAVRGILRGRDARRLLFVVGPCSIHDPEASLEYAARLRQVMRETRGRLVLVMRTYFEKPRTALGWKGLIADPHLDGSGDVAAGLALARRLLARVNDLGVPCATEFLDPAVAPYLEDLISWGCIGARTAENPVHRHLASGLPMPIGIKNGTDGGVEAAVNAMTAAGQPHTILGIGPGGRIATRLTRGNPDTHVVLRGGRSGPNYGREHLEHAWSLLGRPSGRRLLLVDCAHGNSGKDPARQGPVCRAVLDEVLAGRREIMGLALESNLRAGSQAPGPRADLAPGVSVTDPCIGWEETRRLLTEAAAVVDRRA